MKVLWYESRPKPEVVTYDPKRHLVRAWNFLFWKAQGDEEDFLIVGDGGYDHPQRAAHIALRDCCADHANIPSRTPDGAGNLRDGRVFSWNSTGFGVSTPEGLMSLIKSALGIHDH